MFQVARGAFALFVIVAVSPVRADNSAPATTSVTVSNASEAKLAPPHLVPGPNDARIAYVAARMLEANHYRQMTFDERVSEKFYDGYLDTLDSAHLIFTQGDLDEWADYRGKLHRLTLKPRGEGDTQPAFDIFNRYFERLEQRVTYVDELLKDPANFNFSVDERILINRKDELPPTNLDEAKKLWRERLRFEYLQEKLARTGAKKKTATASTTAFSTPVPATVTTNSTIEPAKKKTDAEEIADLLSRRYHRNLRFFKEWDNEDVMQVYLTALAHVYDPHSDYFNASGSDNFSIGMSLSLFGIGAQLKSEDGYCTIDKLLPGGPAAKSGKIKERDRVVAVAQGDGPFEDVVEMSLNKAVRLIRGAKGSEVRLVLMPASDPTSRQTLALIRDEIKLEDQEAKARIIDMPVGDGKAARVGVIDLPSFYATVDLTGERRNSERRSSTADVARLLKKLEAEKVEGVILDLRRNGGGSLEEAIGITGLFIKSGPVVQAKGPGKDSPVAIEEDRDGGKQLYDGPLILLTSRGTASASEIVAGALQDYGRALIVGDISTHGKGTVQNLNPLTPYVRPATPSATNDPGTLKLTIRKFYRAGGASTQLKGVMPDIVLPSILNVAKDVGERAQENALEWDTLPSTKFDRVNLVAPYLAELLRRSNGRVATNRDFVYVREDIEKFRARQEDKTVSLNERERLQEKETDDTRQKARKQELLARHEPPATVYELTLRLADQPGLPPAVEKTNSSVAKVSAPATGFGTNSASLTPRPVRRDVGLEGDDEELDPPAVDVALEEAEHIMLDYVGLAHKGFVSLAH